MIELIIRSYFSILLAVGIAACCMLLMGMFLILKKANQKTSLQNKEKRTVFTEPYLTPISESINEVSSLNNNNQWQEKLQKNRSRPDILADLNAIAGDDVLTTQLDLARAYIETGKQKLAQTILNYVAEQGSATQQQEAQRLLRLT